MMFSHILLIRSAGLSVYMARMMSLSFITCFLSLADTDRPLYNMQLCTYFQPSDVITSSRTLLSHSFVMDVIHCDFQNCHSLCSLTSSLKKCIKWDIVESSEGTDHVLKLNPFMRIERISVEPSLYNYGLSSSLRYNRFRMTSDLEQTINPIYLHLVLM